MSFQSGRPPRTEWTGYATLTLILLFIASIAQVLQVPHSISQWLRSLNTQQDQLISQVSPVPDPAPVPAPVVEKKSHYQDMCAEWISSNSQKPYDFICTGPSTLDVHEASNGQINKIGSGRIVTGGRLEAVVVSPTKNRKGYWELQLSPDKSTMAGTWHGDDPRESGRLEFRKLK